MYHRTGVRIFVRGTSLSSLTCEVAILIQISRPLRRRRRRNGLLFPV